MLYRPPLTCNCCGAKFEDRGDLRKYCSRACYDAENRKRAREASEKKYHPVKKQKRHFPPLKERMEILRQQIAEMRRTNPRHPELPAMERHYYVFTTSDLMEGEE